MSFVNVAIAGSAAVGLIGAKTASSAAGKAASEQTDATKYAADLQSEAAEAALAEQKRQFNVGQANLQPWLQAGTAGLGALQYGLGLSTAQPAAGGTAPASMLNPLDPLRSGDPQKLAELQGLQTSLPQQIAALEARIADLNNRGKTQGGGLIGNFAGDAMAKTQQEMLSRQLEAAKAQLASLPKDIAGMYGMTPEQYQAAQQAQQAQTSATPAATDGTAPAGNYAGTGMAHGELMQNFDPETVKLDDGFEFRLNQGLQALERSGAAKGSGIGGGALKAITEYAQDYSSGEYDKAYARTFNTFEANQANRYNKLAALAGVGQQTAQQINASGQAYANNVGNITQNNASALGELAAQGANARASSHVASGNAWNGALGGISSNVMDLLMMRQRNAPINAGI